MDRNEVETEDDQSPIQQGIEIHRRRIDTILQHMIEKLCVGCCLTKLKSKVDNSKLSLKQYKSLMKLSNSAVKYSAASSIRSVRSRIHSKKNVMEFSRDANVSMMIAQLHHNPEIMRVVNELIFSLPQDKRQFINEMIEFKEYILEILQTTASAERAFNKSIGQAWVNNEKYKKKNSEMEIQHSNKLYELSFKIREKKNIIESYKKQIEQSHETCISDLRRIINESERSMTKTSKASAEQQELLSEEAKNITNTYQNLLERHLAHEKSLRTKRYKVETVLAGWLAKFDQDIGDLQQQLEEQQDGYNSEKAAFDDLTERYEMQTSQYDVLMTEKAEEEQKIFDKKRYIFISNRSARIIQRWWRRILSKIWKRRKGKGKGKGKKGKK